MALAMHDKALSATLAARLTAERDAVAILCSSRDPARLLSWLHKNRADVLLLDERWLQRFGAAGSFARLRRRWPDQCVLIVGDRACTALAEQIVRHRLQGFLLATGAIEACVKAVRAVKRGEMWVPRALLVDLLFAQIRTAGQSQPESAAAKLTRRESEIIGYVRRGFANKQIARSLAIREDTVKKHLRNAYTKLGVHRRSELMTGTM